ncbi:hypothetical protein Vadar_032730 [Vaccinium darrowii]|uniref:Uncharacterized protein n=1 Tax=Vaccinium darrowii TaxID=229202 RepID=A0ACB7YRS0_9ERIC|nr:hypothetical protein Vadar_032730 [Vaccinium darrowii]
MIQKRDVNDGFKVNTQSHLLPILATSVEEELNKVFSENRPVESASSIDGKKANEKSAFDNHKHHSLLLQAVVDVTSSESSLEDETTICNSGAE